MKNETIAAIASVLLLILGVQAYTTYQLSERLNQLSGMSSALSDSPFIKCYSSDIQFSEANAG